MRFVEGTLASFVIACICAALPAVAQMPQGAETNLYSQANSTMRSIKAASTIREVVELDSGFQSLLKQRLDQAPPLPQDKKYDEFALWQAEQWLVLLGEVAKQNLSRPVQEAMRSFELGPAGGVVGSLLSTTSTSTPRQELRYLGQLVHAESERRIEQLLQQSGQLQAYQDVKAGLMGRAKSITYSNFETKTSGLTAQPSKSGGSIEAPPTVPATFDCSALKDPARSAQMLAASEALWLEMAKKCTK